MRLTYDENEWIRKQYIRFMKGKVTLEKFNNSLQKKFQTEIDFKEVITYCYQMNKGSSDIGWKLAEV